MWTNGLGQPINALSEAFDDAPFSLTYYRLKMTEKDGTIRFSKIIAVKRPNTEGSKIKLYPNPVNDILTIDNTNGQNITIVNVFGQVVLSAPTTLLPTHLVIQHLQNGVYFLKIGEETERFIKN